MPLPYNLQKLPPEALDVLRYMGKTSRAESAETLEEGTKLTGRLIGKAIRRLVNYDYIHMVDAYTYSLTTDGNLAVKQLADYDATENDETVKAKAALAQRRLTVVMPRSFVPGRPTDVYFGVNPPDGQQIPLSGTAHIELKISAVGGTLSVNNVSLDIPPDKAAAPRKVGLTPAQLGKPVRVRVDAFQAFEFDSMEPLGGMYFDVQVSTEPVAKDATSRAVGMDLLLKPPR